MPQSVTLELPDSIYERFRRMAEATTRNVEDAVMETLSSSLPPAVEGLPPEIQQELLALEHLNDDKLWKVARSMMSKAKQRKWALLIEKNRNGTLTPDERQCLNEFVTEADRITLRKAHAYALLKWRGHRLPILDGLALHDAAQRSSTIASDFLNQCRVLLHGRGVLL